MNIENYIEAQYRELQTKGLNAEFLDLYKNVEYSKLREIITTLHHYFTSLFRTMNERLPLVSMVIIFGLLQVGN